MSEPARRFLSRPERLHRTLASTTLWTVAATLVVAGVLLAALRVMLPGVEHYRPEVETWLSGLLGHRVTIGELEAYWHGWQPELRAADVRLVADPSPAGRPRTLLRFASATVTVDPRASIEAGELRPDELSVGGAAFSLVRRADGSFALRGVEQADVDPGDGEAAARWLLTQRRLRLASSRVTWVDERAGRAPLTFDDVNLDVRNDGGRHRIQGTASVPGGGDRIEFALDVEGDLLTPSWSGTAFVDAEGVDVALAEAAGDAFALRDVAGPLSATLWSTWRFGRFVRAEGEVRARGLEIGGRDHRLRIDDGGGRFVVERDAGRWTLDVRDLVIATANGVWPSTALSASWTPAGDDAPARVVADIGYLGLEDVAPALAALAPGARRWPAAAARVGLRGALRDVRVAFERDAAGRVRAPELRARVEGLGATGAPGLPASVEGLAGELEADTDAAVLRVSGGRARLDAPHLLAAPVVADGVGARIGVVPVPGGVRIEVDEGTLAVAGVDVGLTGWALWPHDGTVPELSAVARVAEAELGNVLDLVAGAALPPPVREWLARAEPRGRVRGAELLVHGRLDELPFDGASGRLEARARLDLEHLGYARGWPALSDVSGEMRFDGRGVHATIDSARVVGARIESARVAIADMTVRHPHLAVSGVARGSSADAMRFLAESPLHDEFRHLIENVAVSGESRLAIDIGIGLATEPEVAVDGRLALTDNLVSLPGLDQGLEAVTGEIGFGRGGVEAERVEASYLGRPIRLAAGSSPAMEDATRVRIAGTATREHLTGHLHNAGLVDRRDPRASLLLGRLRGDARWTATLDIPHAGTASGTEARLRVHTDLVGAGFDLPAPLAKPPEAARELVVESVFGAGGSRRMQVRYEGAGAGTFELEREGERYRLRRGAVRLGPGEPHPPQGSGIRVHGRLPVLDVGDWHELMRGVGVGAGGASPLEHVRGVDVELDAVRVLGSRFANVRFEARHGADGAWRAEVRGPDVDGVVEVPADPAAAPVRATFERLALERDAGASGDPLTLDPGALPALEIVAKHLLLGDLDFGLVKVVTSPRPEGLAIDELFVLTDAYETRATGAWRHESGAHATRLDARMHGNDLGALLRAFGYEGEATRGGAAEIALDAAWPGSPADFDLARLAGVLHFRASEGRLLEVDRGAVGRAFGLLSLTSLPRRLTLDFSDLFERGLAYDRMEGSFSIEDGNAYTNNLVLESETARIEVAGRTGIADWDYDQIVTVTPKLTSSLPLAAIWLAEKVLKRKVFDNVFSYQYTITGPWDDPEVERVVADPPTVSPADRG